MERGGASGKGHVFGSEFIAFNAPGDLVGICESGAPGLSETSPSAHILDCPTFQGFQLFGYWGDLVRSTGRADVRISSSDLWQGWQHRAFIVCESSSVPKERDGEKSPDGEEPWSGERAAS